MIRTLLSTFFYAVVFSGLLGFQARAGTSEALLARGENLFFIGGCGHCHTAEDGPMLAGGDPLKTPFGTFYPPNITPDPETGIGNWSEKDLTRALREGISPHGQPYYPAFPFISYTLMKDEDLTALKAYLDTVPPIRHQTPAQELSFPFSVRSGLWGWRWLFFRPGRFQPDPMRSAQWNRGAYLVQGPGHCGECHTPRNWMGALDRSRAYAGSVLGELNAPNITPDPEYGIGEWSETDLLYFFETGMKPDGDTASGEMAKVIRKGISKLPEEDLRAIIEYLQSLPPIAAEP
ncbi:MAG: cytochrome c [Methylothermaceae bacterium]|nr:cytochrome c [Methylothermaceae bacterium]